MTWDETTERLMNVLTPSDCANNESKWHSNMRNYTVEIQGTADSPPFSVQELTEIVKSLNVKKAAGHDLIEVKMVKEAWSEI